MRGYLYLKIFSVLLISTGLFGQTPGVVLYTHVSEGDGSRLTQNICTIHTDGSNQRCLTNDGNSFHPSWSPDGKQIVFVQSSLVTIEAPHLESKQYQLRPPNKLSVMSADGRNLKLLRKIDSVIYWVRWSPDGKAFAIGRGKKVNENEQARAGLYILNADGKGPLRHIRSNAWTPSWSPDGSRIAFTVEHPRGKWNVYIANANGTNEVKLTHSDHSGQPSWSPDGKWISFEQLNEKGIQQIFLMDTEGRNIQQVTKNPDWSCGSSTWLSDSEIIVGCVSAVPRCGMVSSTGGVQPPCRRRLFILRKDEQKGDQSFQGKMLMDQDASFPQAFPK